MKTTKQRRPAKRYGKTIQRVLSGDEARVVREVAERWTSENLGIPLGELRYAELECPEGVAQERHAWRRVAEAAARHLLAKGEAVTADGLEKASRIRGIAALY